MRWLLTVYTCLNASLASAAYAMAPAYLLAFVAFVTGCFCVHRIGLSRVCCNIVLGHVCCVFSCVSCDRCVLCGDQRPRCLPLSSATRSSFPVASEFLRVTAWWWTAPWQHVHSMLDDLRWPWITSNDTWQHVHEILSVATTNRHYGIKSRHL